MDLATISSLYSTPFETNSNIRDDSFSSYLAHIRQSFYNELSNPSSSQDSFQGITSPPPPSPPPRKTSRVNDREEELDVFRAEKYYTGTLDVQDSAELLMSSADKKTRTKDARSQSNTWSETTSVMAHSHSALLHDRRPVQQRGLARADRRRRFFDVFRCSCVDKNAVVVDDDVGVDARLGRKKNRDLRSESSPDLFAIDSVSTNSQYPGYEPSEASIEWSVATTRPVNFPAVVKADGVRSLERYHVMMGLESLSMAGAVATRPRRMSAG